MSNLSEDHDHGVEAAPLKPLEHYELGFLPSLGLLAGSGAPPVGVETSYPFIWPATGPITSYIGPSHPTGIDIGLAHLDAAPIVAMAEGSVIMVGGGADYDYGLFVMLDHGEGLRSLYAHLSRIAVRPGQRVEQGQYLGDGGSTGKSSGTHLHFEVQYEDGIIDPLRLLPARPSTSQRASTDCTTAFVLDRGARATLNLAAFLPGGSITSASLEPSVPGLLAVSAPAASSIELHSTPSIAGPREDEYILRVHLSAGDTEKVAECPVILRTRSMPKEHFALASVPVAATKTRVPATQTATPVVARSADVEEEPSEVTANEAEGQSPGPPVVPPEALEAFAIFSAATTASPTATPTPAPSMTPTSVPTLPATSTAVAPPPANISPTLTPIPSATRQATQTPTLSPSPTPTTAATATKTATASPTSTPR